MVRKVDGSARKYGGDILLHLLGDDQVNLRMAENYCFGSLEDYKGHEHDATMEDYSRPRDMDVNNTSYSVLPLPSYEYTWAPMYSAITKRQAPIVLLTYNVLSKASFENLDKLIKRIALPPNGEFHIMTGSGKHRVVKLNHFYTVLVGSLYPAHGVREVTVEEAEAFASKHPGCTFAGECEPDEGVNRNLDEVFLAAVKIYHKLRIEAQAAQDLEEPKQSEGPRDMTQIRPGVWVANARKNKKLIVGSLAGLLCLRASAVGESKTG